jgi:hypothetical protein
MIDVSFTLTNKKLLTDGDTCAVLGCYGYTGVGHPLVCRTCLQIQGKS